MRVKFAIFFLLSASTAAVHGEHSISGHRLTPRLANGVSHGRSFEHPTLTKPTFHHPTRSTDSLDDAFDRKTGRDQKWRHTNFNSENNPVSKPSDDLLMRFSDRHELKDSPLKNMRLKFHDPEFQHLDFNVDNR